MFLTSIFRAYSRLAVFAVGILLGIQVPSFVEQYNQRIDAHFREVNINISGFKLETPLSIDIGKLSPSLVFEYRTYVFTYSDKEKNKIGTEYFGLGNLEVSFNDKLLGYSLDVKGSEYYTIYVRRISDEKLVTEKIEETSGSISFSLDDEYIFYSKLDSNHRPRKILRHKIGTSVNDDKIIFDEKDEKFTEENTYIMT